MEKVEEKKTKSYVYNQILQVPADLFTFSKEIIKENITFYAMSVSTKFLCVSIYI